MNDLNLWEFYLSEKIMFPYLFCRWDFNEDITHLGWKKTTLYCNLLCLYNMYLHMYTYFDHRWRKWQILNDLKCSWKFWICMYYTNCISSLISTRLPQFKSSSYRIATRVVSSTPPYFVFQFNVSFYFMYIVCTRGLPLTNSAVLNYWYDC